MTNKTKGTICAILLIILCIVAGFALTSCYSTGESNKICHQFKGNHELKKFNIKTSTTTTQSAFFFLVVGGYDSKTTTNTNVRMYFKNCKGLYEFLEVPLNHIQIQIDSIIIPYIVFDCNKDVLNRGDVMGHNLPESLPIILHCKESDFTPEININDIR
jgi:hypothetical protein